MRRLLPLLALLAAACTLPAAQPSPAPMASSDVVIEGGHVMDGTGSA
ncbi:hypothetical protein BH20GEM3_BH20GEM3_14950 [soil metagenome]